MAAGLPYPQVKVCGLTRPDEAAACANAGADAIGLVFYPPSPRHISRETARRITSALPSDVAAVGVFVDPDWETLLQYMSYCRLDAVQLHGAESPKLVRQLAQSGIPVVKALFAARAPGFDQVDRYTARAFLLECGKGKLPGGNAETWDWSAAAPIGARVPAILAGGLTVDNITDAIAAGLPDAVDASSAFEVAPGRKDVVRVRRFIARVRAAGSCYQAAGRSIRPVFDVD